MNACMPPSITVVPARTHKESAPCWNCAPSMASVVSAAATVTGPYRLRLVIPRNDKPMPIRPSDSCSSFPRNDKPIRPSDSCSSFV